MEHTLHHNHMFNWSNVDIFSLDDGILWHKRIVSEIIYINLQSEPINNKEDSKNVHSVYNNLLHKINFVYISYLPV